MKRNQKGRISLILLILVLGIGGLFLYRQYQIRSKSVLTATTSSQALLSLQPNALTLNSDAPTGSVKLVVTTNSLPVGFVHTEINFNPSKVHLAQDITTTSSLSRVVKVTPAAEANSTGNIVLALAVAPGTTIPSGSITLGTLVFKSNTTSSDSDDISIRNYKVINTTPELYTASSNGLTITLNPSVTPPEPPTPPTPPTTDLTSPTISITSPSNGTVLTLKKSVILAASALDEQGGSGMNKVEFWVNNSLKCTDTVAPYTCSWKPTGKKGASFTIKAVAYDKAGNNSFSEVTVTAK